MDKRFRGILTIFAFCMIFSFLFIPGIAKKIPVFSSIVEKFYRLDLMLYDSHINSSSSYTPSDKIRLIVIDHDSEEKLGAFPWPRVVHGELVKKLTEAGAAVIVFDVGFIGYKDKQSDLSFAKEAEKSGKVISCAFLGFDKDDQVEVLYPYKELKDSIAACGYPELNRDQDHVIRKVQIYNKNFSAIDPLFLAALKLYYKDSEKFTRFAPNYEYLLFAGKKIPLEADMDMLINFPGKPYKKISYIEALEKSKDDPDYQKFVDENIKDKILIVMSVTDINDQFKIPRLTDFGAAGKKSIVAGGEIHAAALQTVLEDRYIRHVSDFEIWIAGFILCFIGMLTLAKLNYFQALPVFVGEIIGYFFLIRFLFSHYYIWINFYIPAAMLSICWVSVFVFESRRIKEIFKQFIPKTAVEKILKSERETELGGKTVEATALFSDIRGYTTLSEKMAPEDVLNFLNRYHARMSDIIERNHGYTFDYAGDGSLVVFGAPEPVKDHETWAVKAAIEMQEETEIISRNILPPELPPLRIGIGICTGKIAYGLMGKKTLKRYSAIGDVINTSARLQGLSDQMHCQIISDSATEQVIRGKFKIKNLGRVPVKGKNEPVQIFGISKKNIDEIEDLSELA